MLKRTFQIVGQVAVLIAGLNGMNANAAEPAAYQSWKANRLSALTQPTGWLSLVGLHWVEPGKHSIGAGKRNAIQLAGGPKQLGTITLGGDGSLVLTLKSTDKVLVDGKAASSKSIVLATDKSGAPTEVVVGSLSFFAIDRSGRLALRVKDTTAKTRTAFKGLDYFPYNESFQITGKYQAYPTPRTINVATIVGTVEPTPNPGRAIFELQGKTYTLELLEGSDSEHFFTVIGDRTNGKTTYGMARFLVGTIDPAKQTVELNFNALYNPPCAFTAFATCPMPPEGNRLAIELPVGEKKYAGGAH
jgi:uncharacterized protein